MEWYKDIYFAQGYGQLYEKYEHGTFECFECISTYGRVIHNFIRRSIPDLCIQSEQYYDIRTPYGYGGPIICECSDKAKLLKTFETEFSEYCKKNHIVTEFVRFHPLAENADDFKSIYSLMWNRKTVGTNVLMNEDPFVTEFSSSCRKNIRRALRKGVTFRYEFKPDNLTLFQNIYFDTMNRNHVEDFYYFDEEYFRQLVERFGEQILVIYAEYQQTTIAAGLYFICEDVAHVHLSGTLAEYLELSPAYVLRYALLEWCKEKKVKLIHHGGGRTAAEDDALYLFKKQFGVNTAFDFYISEKVWDEEIYRILSDLKAENETVNDYIRRKSE